jgi:hypothetical protein
MDDECPPEVIRKQMEETRSQISEKLEILETQINDTVQSTTTAVNETVGAVKDTVESVTGTVQDTVQSVGEVLDLRLQAERHPWLVFGGSIAVGYLASGYLFDRRSRVPAQWPANLPMPEGMAAASIPVPPRDSWFKGQLRQLRGLAVGALMDVVRDIASKGLPRPTVRPPEKTPDPDATVAPFRANVSGKRTA